MVKIKENELADRILKNKHGLAITVISVIKFYLENSLKL